MGEPVRPLFEGTAAALDGAGQSDLTPQELAILEFERQWWRYPGSKEGAIRELFSMSSPRYY